MCKICDEPQTPIAKGGGVLKRYDGATIARGCVEAESPKEGVCSKYVISRSR